MGCSESRLESSAKELNVSCAEAELDYSRLSIQEIDLIHRKYSLAGKINENHWREICKHFAINTAKPHIKTYFEAFDTEGYYQLNEMLTLGILLGSGKSKARAKLLFEAYDDFDAKVLEKESLVKMYNIIYDISVNKAKQILKLSQLPEDRKTSGLKFLESISLAKKAYKTEFLLNILGTSINCTLEGFITAFSNELKGKSLTSAGFRNALKNRAKKDEQKHKKQSNSN